jgi:outer membrane lipase/esterase
VLGIELALFVVAMHLLMATPTLAQTGSQPFTPLSGIPGLTPPEEAVGRAVETLCPRLSPRSTGATGDLQIRCTELVGNALAGNQTGVRNPLLEMSTKEVSSQGTSSIETSNIQFTNVSARLAALRSGVRGLSLRGLAFNVNGKPLPDTLLAGLLPAQATSDSVSADGGNIFPRFKAWSQRHTPIGPMAANPSSQGTSRAVSATDEPSPFGRLGVFLNGTISFGDKDSTSRETGFDFDTYGVTGGLDYRFTDNFILGAAFGYANSNADFSADGGDLDTDAYSVSIFGTYYVNRFYIDGIVNFGWIDYETNRNIVYSVPRTDRVGNVLPGTTSVNQTANSETDGMQYSFSVGAGYDFTTGGFTFGPYARVNYLKADIDGFDESIGNANPGFGLALAIDNQDVESFTTAFGAQGSYAFSTGFGVLVPLMRLEWEHEFLDDRRTVTARFVNDPTRTPISLDTDDPDRNFFNLGFGLSAVFARGMGAFVYYETVLGLRDVTAHNIALGVRLGF